MAQDTEYQQDEDLEVDQDNDPSATSEQQTSPCFRNKIQHYLERRAAADPIFGATYAKPHKNLDDCCTYIANVVQQSGIRLFDDSEIYAMAVHYYDQNVLDIGSPLSFDVAISSERLSPEEMEQARTDAFETLKEAAYNKMKSAEQKKRAAKKPETDNQSTLF